MVTQEFSANLNWLCTNGFAKIQRMICLVNRTHTFGTYIRFPHTNWLLSEWSSIKRFFLLWWIKWGWLETRIVHHFRHFLYEERKGWKGNLLWSLLYWCSVHPLRMYVVWLATTWLTQTMNQNMLTKTSKQGFSYWMQSHTAGRTTCRGFQYPCLSI